MFVPLQHDAEPMSPPVSGSMARSQSGPPDSPGYEPRAHHMISCIAYAVSRADYEREAAAEAAAHSATGAAGAAGAAAASPSRPSHERSSSATSATATGIVRAVSDSATSTPTSASSQLSPPGAAGAPAGGPSRRSPGMHHVRERLQTSAQC